MTWDNIKIGFLKWWAEGGDFKRAVIFLGSFLIFTIMWTILFAIFGEDNRGWWALIGVSVMASFLSSAGLVVLFMIGDGVCHVLQKLNDVGQEEKDKTFNALKQKEPEEEEEITPAQQARQFKKQYARNLQPPKSVDKDQRINDMLEALRKMKGTSKI